MSWIKVTDELPKDFTDCWVYDGEMQEPEMSTFLNDVFYYFTDDWDGIYKNITHWQRLIAPLPPGKR